MDRARLGFGVANLVVAGLVAVGVFHSLPTRYWLVDGGALIVVGAQVVSGTTILAGAKAHVAVARVASLIVLAIGLALILALSLTASFLSGTYGPVGQGGAVLYVFIAALVLPYALVFPAAQLLWLGAKKAP